MNVEFTRNTKFTTGSGETVSLSDTIVRIRDFIKDAEEYTIEIGSDSHTTNKTKLITAIVVHKTGKGGIFFYKTTLFNKMTRLRDKIYTETTASINCAQQLISLFLDNEIFVNITIHCDIGPNGKTRELIKEIIGYIIGSGFDCVIKPNENTACAVADKFSK